MDAGGSVSIDVFSHSHAFALLLFYSALRWGVNQQNCDLRRRTKNEVARMRVKIGMPLVSARLVRLSASLVSFPSGHSQ